MKLNVFVQSFRSFGSSFCVDTQKGPLGPGVTVECYRSVGFLRNLRLPFTHKGTRPEVRREGTVGRVVVSSR